MSEELKIVVWDVQHGHAVYFQTPGGQDFVIDLGTGSYGDSDYEFSPLLHLKRKYDVVQLDGVIITHPHRDHLDDIFNFENCVRETNTSATCLHNSRVGTRTIACTFFKLLSRFCAIGIANANVFPEPVLA